MDREYALGLQGGMICRCRGVGMGDVIRGWKKAYLPVRPQITTIWPG
jgi:hypothetical protein